METIALVSLIVLGVCFITNSIFLYNLYLKNKELNEELLEKSNTLNDQGKIYDNKYKKILEISEGSMILFTHSLVSTTDNIKTSFSVLYEGEVLSRTEKKVKVKATTYTSNDAFAKDPANRNVIISFMNNKWVEINEVELIIDDSTRRAIKLDIIGV
jgi:Na+/melibiose symporter-like transporter